MDTPITPALDKENLNGLSTENSSKNKLESISFFILLLTFFLSPLLFVSSNYFPMDSIKSEVIIFGLLISFILYIISALQKKNVSCSKNPIMILGGLIAVSTIISALASTNIQKSLIGQGFELGSASFLILMFVAMVFVSKIVSKNRDRLLTVYGSFMLSFLLLGLFHLFRALFSASFLSFGSLNSVTSTLIGKWSDLGIFAAAIFLLSFFALTLFTAKKSIKILVGIIFVLSAFSVFLVNSSVIWAVIAITLLAYGIYYYCQTPGEGAGITRFVSRISLFTLALFIISIVLALVGSSLQTSTLKSYYQEQTEISLPWQLTLDVAADTIKEKPLFGAGPNRFGNEFLLHKPLVLNPSAFWSVEFGTGFGFLPSMIVTHGLVGGVLWIIFFVFFFILGVRGLKKSKDIFAKFSITSSFFVAAFLWVMTLLFSPSHVVILLTFVVTGIFLAALTSEGIITTSDMSLSSGSKGGKMLNLVLAIVLILAIIWTLIYIKKFVALSYFQSGLSTLNTSGNKDVDRAEGSFRSALAWDKSDIYYQVISGVDILKTTPILQQLQEQSQKDPKTIDQELVKKLTAIMSDAASSSMSAVNIDPTNYYNYIAGAKVFELAASLKYDNAYDNAKSAYSNALKYNPYSPQLYLNLAQLDASNDKMDEAQQFIGNALQLKQNYTEAIFLLSQIQVSQNKIKDAIISAQVMTQINPQNPMLFFQLGFLHYNDKNYEAATEALKKAVEFNNQYANARYFLGLSLARLNKIQDAIVQFEEIAKTNPENQEVAGIIANLKNGKSPFTETKNSVDTKPEKRSTLPVKEKTLNTNTNTTPKVKTTTN